MEAKTQRPPGIDCTPAATASDAGPALRELGGAQGDLQLGASVVGAFSLLARGHLGAPGDGPRCVALRAHRVLGPGVRVGRVWRDGFGLPCGGGWRYGVYQIVSYPQ
ncbi:hypothetical protein Ntsu_39410 [Nocardia sp. IFM 10818]